MRKNRIATKIIVCLFLLISISCKRETTPEEFPNVGVPLEELNKKIELLAPYGLNTFRTRDVVGLSVRIIGDEPIAFTHDYGARLFIPQNGEWEEVRNFGTYPRGIIIVPPWDNNPRNEGAAGVGPELPDPEKPVLLRIVLIGNVYRNEQVTDERVGAYIDVELKP